MMKTNPFLVLFIVAFGLIAFVTGINVPFALFLVAAGLCYLLSFRLDIKRFALVLFALSFVIRLVFIFLMNTPLTSDFETLFNAAKSFAKDDYSFSQTRYFSEWAYQTAFVVYEGTIIKIFGAAGSVMVLKVLNALVCSASCVMVYAILQSFVSEKVSRFSALLGSFLIFPLSFVTVLSNQQLSTLLMLSGLYFFTGKNITLRGWVRALISGLLLALGNIIRPEGVIIMGSIGLFFLLRLINPRHERRGAILSKAAVLFAVYLGVNLLISQWIILSGVNPQGLSNNNFLYKFVVGLNHETLGFYSDKDVALMYGQDLTQDERMDLERDLIGLRLKKGPGSLLSLFIGKQHLLWGGNPLLWSYQHLMVAGDTVKPLGIAIPIKFVDDLLWRYHNLQMFILFLFSIMGAVILMKSPHNQQFMVFYLILLASAAAYLVVEIQPRYIYLQEIILVITAAMGLEGLLQKLAPKPKSQGPVLL